MGLRSYLTTTPGIGGSLRNEPEDFRVIEVGDDPPERDGPFTVARIRLRNWETNRFVGRAAKEVGLNRKNVGFAGMKDKRAVTEQWFSFKCPPDRLQALEKLQDVKILNDPYTTTEKQYPGAHAGNRFVLRVRGATDDPDALRDAADTIRQEGGVPNFFGPQRFGSSVRPVTPLMGKAIVAGELEEAVRLYVGHPLPGEPEDVNAARTVYEETRDPEATLELMPQRFDFERSILKRLQQKPGEWRPALMALPRNLLQLFVHSYQSLLFNEVISARIEAGLGLGRAHEGDRVMGIDEDGLNTVEVRSANEARIQRELDKGRAFVTAPLVGMDTQMAHGEPGDIEARIMDDAGIDTAAFRCRELPQVATQGRRRAILQPVGDLDVGRVDDDPVFSFRIGRGAYATVVVREFMKAPPSAY